MALPTPRDLTAEVKAAWAAVDAPPIDDMDIMDWEYGEAAMHAFVGVRPADVDISSVGFKSATPLLELPANASAAYLGPYLVSLLQGFEIQEAVGFPVDVRTTSHTIFALSTPGFWTDVASPHLSTACVSVLGKVARFIIDHAEAFMLSKEEAQGLERLVRSVDRHLKSPRSRSP